MRWISKGHCNLTPFGANVAWQYLQARKEMEKKPSVITRSFMALPDCIRAPAQVIVPCTMLLAFSKMAPEFLSYSIESVTKFYWCFSPYFSSQSLHFHFQGLPESWPDLPEYITTAASNTAKKRGKSGCLHLMLSLIRKPTNKSWMLARSQSIVQGRRMG